MICAEAEFLLVRDDETLCGVVDDRDTDISFGADTGFDDLRVETGVDFDTRVMEVDTGLDVGVEVDSGLETLGEKVDVGLDNRGILAVDAPDVLVEGDNGLFFGFRDRFNSFFICVT